MISPMNHNRVGMKRCHGFRGFRLNPRKFSVQRLRSKFLFLLRIHNKWRSLYGNALQSLRRNMTRNSSKKDRHSSSRRNLVTMKEEPCVYSTHHYRLHYYGRSNSFYSEAIADCLDFIKRNSISVDDEK